MNTSDVKKKIIADWSAQFTTLSVFAPDRLYRTVGPFVLGLKMLKVPRVEKYRPIYICYPLWRPNVKLCLDEPIFMQEIDNRKGLQFDIPYAGHNTFFSEAVECTKGQASILMQEKISLKQLLGAIDEQFSGWVARGGPVGQAKLWEAKFFGALYVNDLKECWLAFAGLEGLVQNWEPRFLDWKYGNLHTWLQGLKETIPNRDNFLKQVELNKLDKKISRLKSTELL